MVYTAQWNGIWTALVCLLLSAGGSGTLLAQTTWDSDGYRDSMILSSKRMETRKGGINDPFVGITTDGKAIPDLYPIESTGVSTAPIVAAAEAFLRSLDPEQIKQASFPVHDIEWRKWANQANYVRDGLGFEKMSEAQRQAAFDMMGASLSADGLKLTQDIMKTNHTLGELVYNNFAKYGEWKYWISMMGTPSATEPWGWQLDGHHLIINYVVVGDQVVMTPALWGAEPTIAKAGKYKGVEVLVKETDIGIEMIQSLTPEQQKKAIIQVNKDAVNILTQAFSDNAIVPYAGIQASDFTAKQKDQLRKVIGIWVGKMRDEHARVRMEEVEQYLDQTWFAWIGDTGDDAVYYYRIQSPVILIEFDHQRAQGLVDLYDHQNALREHVHAVVRTPNGNDYGTDLLKQHYERHSHGDAGPDGKPHWHSH